MNELTGFSPRNIQEPCLCILVLDISSSMAGIPIKELNIALQEFYKSVYDNDDAAEKLEICLVTFNSSVRCIQEPAKVDNFKMPILEASGTTKLVEGLMLAIEQVRLRKEYYKRFSPQYSRPMILVFTDGEPDRDQNIYSLGKQIVQDMQHKRYTLHVIGTSGCNFGQILKFCPKELIYELSGLNYKRFFRWLSQSSDDISNGKPLQDIQGYGDFLKQYPID